MDDTTLRVTTRSPSRGELVLAVEGYLDDAGGSTLAREADAVPTVDHQHVRIDLAGVALFTCAGARRLMAVLEQLARSGCRVDLFGVHHPLQRLLDLSA
jgi:anti-anti-sigma regulatory factor